MRSISSSTAPKGNEWLWNGNASGATAAGNSQGTAYAIPLGQDLTVFSTVGSSTGAVLPAGIAFNEEYAIANHGANSLSIYPPPGGKIGTLSTNAAYSLAAGKTAYFVCVGANQFTASP